MKKFLSAMLAAAMAFSLVACGSSEPAPAPAPAPAPSTSTSTPAPAPSEPTSYDFDLRLTSGSSSSVTYMMCSQYMDMFQTAYPGSTAEVAVGGGVSNLATVNADQFNIGTTCANAALAAMEGIDPFTEVMADVRGVARTDPAWVVAMATKASGITNLKDALAAKQPIRLAVMPVGNYTELAARQLLACYGVTLDDIKAWGGSVQYTSHAEASDLFKDGHLDMYITMMAKGHAYGTEIFTNVDMLMLDLMPEDVQPMLSQGYTLGTMPVDAFRGVDKEVPILISPNIWIANANADEEFVYHVTKTLYENWEDLALTAPSMLETDKATQAADVAGVPLHPGAERYYKEIGALK